MIVQKSYSQRRTRLKKQMKASALEAFLTTNIKNVAYLTGFSGSSGYLFVTKSKAIQLSDFRYAAQIETECDGLEVEIRTVGSEITESVKKVAKRLKCNAIGIEASSITKSLFDQLNESLSAELVDTVGWVEKLSYFVISNRNRCIEKNQQWLSTN